VEQREGDGEDLANPLSACENMRFLLLLRSASWWAEEV
jgi:hypothetical protein